MSFGKYSLPPLEKPIEDLSTGLKVPPGFAVDLIYKVNKEKHGSWIAMAFDKKGHLTVSDQQKAGTFSLEIPKSGEKFDESKWVIPIIANANSLAPSWTTELGLLFIDGSHTEISAMNDYHNWSTKIHPQGALVIHDIYEKPSEGGQAPYLVYQKALQEDFKLYDRVDTIVCLVKA